MEGLSNLLQGRRVSVSTDPLPFDANACLEIFRSRYDTVFNVLGIRKRRAPSDLDPSTLKDTLLAMSRSRVASERRDTLLTLL